MEEWIERALRNPNGRVTGAVYLFYFLTAIPAQFLLNDRLAAYGHAMNLIATALYIVLTLLFYGMFKPVSRVVSLIAALCSLAGCVVMTLGQFHVVPSSMSPQLFFGPYCLLIGYLIFRSFFLPRILGVLMALAGLGWLAFLFAVAHSLTVYIEVLGIFAEASLMLWLIVMGVNVQRWKEQSSGA